MLCLISPRVKIILVISLVLSACSDTAIKKTDAETDKLLICCTTSIVKDAVGRIAGEHAQIVSLMGAGVDPHSYKASQGDLGKLRKADLVFYNGLHLEGKMHDILLKLAKSKEVFALSDSLNQDSIIYYNSDSPDPHYWFDPELWSQVQGLIAQVLIKNDPSNKEAYLENLQRYRKELKLIDQWALDEISSIDSSKKYLITSHDAFQYFSKAYSLPVKALQGVSTSAEFGLRDVADLVDFVCDNNIPALFTETSIPTKFIESVSDGCRRKGHKVIIGESLFSDALGEEGTYLCTYLGVFHHNVNQITQALK